MITREELSSSLREQIDDSKTRIEEAESRLDSVDSQLVSINNTKMDKNTNNIAISQINKNLGKMDETYFTDEFLEKMAGTSGINQTPTLRSVTTSKLAGKSVTPNETDFFEEVINIFDKNTVTDGYALDRSTGDTIVASSYFVSDYMLVEPNTTFTTNKGSTDFCSYDESKKFISGSGLTININGDYTTPSNCCYIRVGSPGSQNIPSLMVMKKINYTETYNEHGKTNLKNQYLDLDYIGKNVKLPNKSLNGTNIDFVGNRLNIFNPSKATIGSSLNTNDGTILTGSEYTNCYVSDFIEILDYVETLYTHPLFYKFICFYDKDKKFIEKGLDGAGESNTSLTVPFKAKYFKISCTDKSTINNMYISENERPPLTYNFETMFIEDNYINKGKFYNFYGKKLVTFGDSLVANNNWQGNICKYFGLTHTNCGIGGSTVAGTDGTSGSNPMWTDDRINTIPYDTDIIIIHAGRNDMRFDRVVGDINSTDVGTFYGAYKAMLDKMYLRCPKARIFILQPFWAKNENYAEGIREAIREIGDLYGYPIYESKKLLGFNDLNKDIFYANENGAYVHINEVGGNRVSDCLIGWLKQFAPYFSNYN